MTIPERVFLSYSIRQCFVCEMAGLCAHREYGAEVAIIEAELNRPIKKEPAPVQVDRRGKRSA